MMSKNSEGNQGSPLTPPFTPFRIENAQRQRYLSLIYAYKVGVLNEKMCKKLVEINLGKFKIVTFKGWFKTKT